MRVILQIHGETFLQVSRERQSDPTRITGLEAIDKS